MATKKTALGKNLAYQMFYQAVVILAPLIVTPYLSRVLGPDELGKYTYAFSVAYYFVLVGTLGITTHGSRRIAAVKDDPEQLTRTYSNLFWLHLAASVTVFAAYVICSLTVFKQNRNLTLIMGFYVASTIFDVKWLFYGLENFRVTAIRNFCVKLITICAIFLLVRTRSDIAVYTWIMAGISFFLAEISLFVMAPRVVKLQKPDRRELAGEFLPLLVMFIPTAGTLICRHIDKVMLGSMSTFAETGFYENTDKVYVMLVTVITVVGDVMLPHMSNMYANGKKKEADRLFSFSLQICSLTACAFMFGIAAIAKEFVPVFFGKEFGACEILLVSIAPTILMLAWSATVRKQYLVPKNRDRVFVISMLIGTVTDIVANALLIPRFDALGAVYGTLIAEGIIVIVQVVMTWKEINYPFYARQTAVFCVIGAVMYLAVRGTAMLPLKGVPQLVTEIAVGGIVYVALALLYLRLTKNEMLVFFFDTLRKKRGKKCAAAENTD
ncbi:MAG: oligosaccharide flippase family protein [Lachnospiraceae bacterium]|nr:oligosaccharide flippase family protein [Lachnospiraceae bacterium]